MRWKSFVIAWAIACRASLGLAAPEDNDTPADDSPPAAAKVPAPPPDWVVKIAERVRPSVIIITVAGRDGSRSSIGSGFIVRADGLIATNLHVIGDARPITVETADGKRHDVVAVEAADRSLDLALVRIAAKELPALELGESSKLALGEPVVAIGNPHGLAHSVVSGVVSGKRKIEGIPMIQLAMPIEPGNSGGPLVDRAGRVHGVLTLKSAVTENLGFAVEIDALKPLLDKPNPVPIARWLTIGALDPEKWTTVFGARWRQRAGRILVEGSGSGFGGRALCLSKTPPPGPAYEVAVTVKLADEDGAAGLVFAADGQDRHFGFYPSAGRLRLSQFEGPDVLSWHVLREEASKAYRADDWNTLKVRVEADRVRCWVNDEPVFEEPVAAELKGAVGLAVFRQTEATFKNFKQAVSLPRSTPDPRLVRDVEREIDHLPKAGAVAGLSLEELSKRPPSDVLAALRTRADALELQADRLRELAGLVHERDTLRHLKERLDRPEAKIDLVEVALWVARLDNDELDVDAYQSEVKRMVREIRAGLGDKADEAARLAALDRYLFAQNGFHGSRGDYYNRSNSYLNEVLDDREGLPITLSILYIELARRLELDVVGVGLPGHFIVRFQPRQGDARFIDVYDAATVLDREALAAKVLATGGVELEDEFLEPSDKRTIIKRLIRNLLSIAEREQDATSMLRYADAILTVDADAADAHLTRALMHLRQGQAALALDDANWLVDHEPDGFDRARIEQLQDVIRQAAEKQAERAEGEAKP